MKEMKVLIILSCLAIGGAEVKAFYLADYLKKRGCKVRIIGITNKEEIYTSMLDENNIEWELFPVGISDNLLTSLFNILKFSFHVKKEFPDIIISYTIVPNIVGAISSKIAKVKHFIWNQRDAGIEKSNILLTKIAKKLTNYYFSNSQSGIDYLIREEKIEQNKIYFMPNSLKKRDYIPKNINQTKYLIKENYDFIANMIGANYSANKDHINVVKAWRLFLNKYKKEGKKALLIFEGRFDSMENAIRDEIQNENLEDSVLMIDSILDVDSIHEISNAFIFYPRNIGEGNPNVVLEACINKIIVIGGDIQPVRDIVSESNYNYLVPLHNPKKLADKIYIVARDKKLQEKIGVENYKKVTDIYNYEKNLEKYYLFMKGLSGKQI